MSSPKNQLSFYLIYNDNKTRLGNLTNDVGFLRQQFNAPLGGEFVDFTTGLARFRVDREYSNQEIQNTLEEEYGKDRIFKKQGVFAIDFRIN